MPIQKNPLPAVNKKIGEKDMGQITENNKRVLENSDTYSEKALTGLFDKYTFAKYLSELIDSKHIKIKDIIQFSNISKTYISDLRDMSQNKQPGRNKLLDLALGIGGVPRGRVNEIYGPESSGKTTLALHIIDLCKAQVPGGVCAHHAEQVALVDPGILHLAQLFRQAQPDVLIDALDVIGCHGIRLS